VKTEQITRSSNDSTLSLKELQSGLYSLTVYSDGEPIGSSKFMKF